jgi:uncharacterized pyridoxamine 5'-phosphate oxidase family protein
MNQIDIEKQIKENYHKAFYDLIEENINSENPDLEWLVRLYEEIRMRFLSYIKNNKKVRKQIEDDFDIEFFKHLISNNVFDFVSMIKLINMTFDWILKLQAPVHDETTIKTRKFVLESDPKKIVSIFIKEVHICLDQIDNDLENLKK